MTSWNLNGVRWREMSATEIMWLVHTTTLDQLKEESPSKVRLYLTQMKDYDALRDWDVSRMKDSHD